MLYLEFELNDVKLKLDKYELYYWFDKTNRGKLKKPYWRKKKLTKSHQGYLRTRINNKRFLFHRIVYYAHNQDWDIYDSSRNNSIDHIDRDKLNNNISNLRVVNNRENSLNTDWVDNAKGYYYNKEKKKYKAYIKLNYKNIHLGYYDTKLEASNKFQKVKLFIRVLKSIYNKNV